MSVRNERHECRFFKTEKNGGPSTKFKVLIPEPAQSVIIPPGYTEGIGGLSTIFDVGVIISLDCSTVLMKMSKLFYLKLLHGRAVT